jgi:hypothetical protein
MFVTTRVLAGLVLAALALVGANVSAAPIPVERVKAQKELAAQATKLHGAWIAGPCEGRLDFRADGTYEWTQRGPGGEAENGAWAVQGTPTALVLVLKCKTADDVTREGKTVELPLVMMENGGFTLKHPEVRKPMEFVRVKCGPRPPLEKVK